MVVSRQFTLFTAAYLLSAVFLFLVSMLITTTFNVNALPTMMMPSNLRENSASSFDVTNSALITATNNRRLKKEAHDNSGTSTTSDDRQLVTAQLNDVETHTRGNVPRLLRRVRRSGISDLRLAELDAMLRMARNGGPIQKLYKDKKSTPEIIGWLNPAAM